MKVCPLWQSSPKGLCFDTPRKVGLKDDRGESFPDLSFDGDPSGKDIEHDTICTIKITQPQEFLYRASNS
jgi:hypothetical protein